VAGDSSSQSRRLLYPRERLPFDLSRDPFPPDREVAISAMFYELASLSSKKPGQRVLTLLSSAANHRALFESCAHDVEAAMRAGPQGNLSGAISLLQSVSWEQPRQRRLIPDRAMEIRGDVGVGLKRHFEWSQRALAEYRDKRQLFEIEFETLVSQAREAFCSSVAGRTLWRMYFEESGYLSPDRDRMVEARMRYLQLVEELLWHLLQALWCALECSSFLTARSNDPVAMLDEHVESYNNLLAESRASHGALLGTALNPESLHAFATMNWDCDSSQTLFIESVKVFAQCLAEIEHFFELYVPAFETAGPGRCRFLPHQWADDFNLTVTGHKEIRLRNHFVLYTDMIGSKLSMRTPEIKDHLNDTFLRYDRDGVYFSLAYDDAFVAVCPSWGITLALSDALVQRVWPFREGPGRFDGLKIAVHYGNVAVVQRGGSNEACPKDLEEPVIAVAAYLCDHVPKLLGDLYGGGDPNRWVALTTQARDAGATEGTLPSESSAECRDPLSVKGVVIRAYLYSRPELTTIASK
jgi:hypothetical protein